MAGKYDVTQNSEWVRFIRDNQKDPAVKQLIDQFMMDCACGMLTAIQAAITKAGPNRGDLKSVTAFIKAPPKHGDADSKYHQWMIKFKGEVHPVDDRMTMCLDRATLALVRATDDLEEPLPVWKWAALNGPHEQEIEAKLSDKEKIWYRALNCAAISALFAAAAAAETTAKVCLNQDRDGTIFSDEGKPEDGEPLWPTS